MTSVRAATVALTAGIACTRSPALEPHEGHCGVVRNDFVLGERQVDQLPHLRRQGCCQSLHSLPTVSIVHAVCSLARVGQNASGGLTQRTPARLTSSPFSGNCGMVRPLKASVSSATGSWEMEGCSKVASWVVAEGQAKCTKAGTCWHVPAAAPPEQHACMRFAGRGAHP